MTSPYLNFLKKLLIFTLIVGVAGWLILQAVPENWQTPVYPFIVVFFFGATLLLHRVMLQVHSGRFAQFTNRFMGITFLKIVAYLVIILVYALLVNPADALAFTASFFGVYLCFTIFEILEMLRLSRSQQAPKQD